MDIHSSAASGMLDIDVEPVDSGFRAPHRAVLAGAAAMEDDGAGEDGGSSATAAHEEQGTEADGQQDDDSGTSVTELQALVLLVLKEQEGRRGYTFPELVKHLQALEQKTAAKFEAGGGNAAHYSLTRGSSAADGGAGSSSSSSSSSSSTSDSPFGVTAELERLSAQVVASLRANERVIEDPATGRFRYSPVYPCADRYEFLDFLKTQAPTGLGLSYDEAGDTYPGAGADLEALTRSGGLLPAAPQATGPVPAGGRRYVSGTGTSAGGRHVGVMRVISDRGGAGSRILPRVHMADEVVGAVDVSTFMPLPGKVSVVHGSFFAVTSSDLTGELFRNDVVVIGDKHFRVSSATVDRHGSILMPSGAGNSQLPPVNASVGGAAPSTKASYEDRMATALLQAVGAQPRSEARLASKRRGGKRRRAGAGAGEDGDGGAGGEEDAGEEEDEEEDDEEDDEDAAAATMRPEARQARSTLEALADTAVAMSADGVQEPAAKRTRGAGEGGGAGTFVPVPAAASAAAAAQSAVLEALVEQLSSRPLPATGVWLPSYGNAVIRSGGHFSVADTAPHRTPSHAQGYALPFTAQLLPLDRPWDGPTTTGLPAFRYGASADLRSLWRLVLQRSEHLPALCADPPKWAGAAAAAAGAARGGAGVAAAAAVVPTTTVVGAGMFRADGTPTGALLPSALGAPGAGAVAIMSRLGGKETLKRLHPFPSTHSEIRAQMKKVGMRETPMLPDTLGGAASTLVAGTAAAANAAGQQRHFLRKPNSRIMQARTNLEVLATNKELAEGLRRAAVQGMVEDMERKKARRDQATNGGAGLNITTVGKKVEYRRVG